jgi:LmeA-like phospholipid-binding
VSDYEPRSQAGWPEQPPGNGQQQPAYGQQQPGYGQQPEYGQQQPAYGQSSGYDEQPSYGRSRPRRRRRRGRGLVITLIVLIAILVAADFGAKAFAENAIASKIDSSGLGVKPSVNIEGFPFLTQVAARDLGKIDINASNFSVHQVVISSLTATATGVHPNASFNGATVDQIHGTMVVSFTTITNLVPVPGLTVSADPSAGPDAIALNSSLGGAVGKIVQTSPNVITVDVGNLSGLAGLASLIGGSAIASSYTIDIPTLPAGLEVRSITVTSQGIVATASAQNTTLSQ